MKINFDGQIKVVRVFKKYFLPRIYFKHFIFHYVSMIRYSAKKSINGWFNIFNILMETDVLMEIFRKD
jgi:hypothetical protein